MTPPADGWAHVSEDERHRIRCYVSYVLDALRLTDWTVGLDWDSTEGNGEDSDVDATMVPIDGRRFGRLAVTARFEDALTDSRKTHLLIHECVHLTHRDVWEQYHQLLTESGYVPRSVQPLLSRLAVDVYEQMVDKWADALVALLEPYPGPLAEPLANVGLLGGGPDEGR